jgi:tetratricopeptide (TPR) repeat protein
VQEPLGTGAFATVYRAELVGIGGFRKPVALKVLRPRTGGAAGGELLEEARLGAYLHHPNVVETYDVGEVDGKLYVAMELVDGMTVHTLLNRLQKLPLDATIELGVQCCAALHYAHELVIGGESVEMVHRDVKPANVLVDRAGGVRLVDFGVAWAKGFLDDPDTGAGTLGYVSPESIRVEHPDRRADIFSLGVVLCEALAGHKPFPLDSFDRYRRALDDPAGALDASGCRAALNAIDPKITAVIERCVARDPDKRYPTAADLGTALEQLGPSGHSLAQHVSAAMRKKRGRSPTGGRPSPPRTAAPARLMLPPASTEPFMGREHTISQLLARIGGAHLLTITGPGGIGKTRVALEFARAVADSFAGGAAFVDLSSCEHRAEAAVAIASVLGDEHTADDSRGELSIKAALEARGRFLLVLDNVDRMVEQRDFFDALVVAAPRARVVCTSRERLRSRREEIFELGPLDEDSAIQLYTERAEEAGYTGGSQTDARHLVQALDGIPLAIELAAARARDTAAAGARDAITDNIKMFRRTLRGPARHATMHATVQWSWDMLAPWERSALAQLSVFRGGFTLDAAVAVVELDAWRESPLPVFVVESLIDKSLLRRRQAESGPRLDMYEVMRRFSSLALLAAEPEHAPQVSETETHARHARYYARFGDNRHLDSLFIRGGVARQRDLHAEAGNLGVAARRAVDQALVRYAVPLCRAMLFAARRGGATRATQRLAAAALRLGDLTPAQRALLLLDRSELRADRGKHANAHSDATEALELARPSRMVAIEGRALRILGNLERISGNLRGARKLLEASLKISRAVDDHVLEANVLSNLGRLNHIAGRTGVARKYYNQALRVARDIGGRELEGNVLGNLAVLEQDVGDAHSDDRHCAALRIHREVGNRNAEAVVLSNLANLYARSGRIEQAKQTFDESMAAHRELGNRRSEAISLNNAALYVHGEAPSALPVLQRALTLIKSVDDPTFTAIILGNLGNVFLEMADLDAARDHLEEAIAFARRVGSTEIAGAFWGSLAVLEARLGDFDVARSHLDVAERALRSAKNREELARVLCKRVEVEHLAGEADAAREALAAAGDAAQEAGMLAERALAKANELLAPVS